VGSAIILLVPGRRRRARSAVEPEGPSEFTIDCGAGPPARTTYFIDSSAPPAPPVPEDAARVAPGQALELARPANPRNQFGVLTRRTADIIRSDRRTLVISLVTAPVIVLLVALVLSGKADDPMREGVKELLVYRQQRGFAHRPPGSRRSADGLCVPRARFERESPNRAKHPAADSVWRGGG
jgi:hypothetical protein